MTRCCSRSNASSGSGIFDPACGGDPLLFQHMFWFYSHPAVYIMILPAMGVVSELIPCFARRPIFGYSWDGLRRSSIAVLSFFVWGHHMFVAGHFDLLGGGFFADVVYRRRPVSDQGVQLDCQLHKGTILSTHRCYTRSVSSVLFAIGGFTGLFVATLGDRYPSAGHLLHRRAFPLHHGRWHGHAPISAGCISGGQRSPGGSIRKCGLASRRS